MVTIYYGKGGQISSYTVGFPGGYFTVYPGKPKLNGVTYTSRNFKTRIQNGRVIVTAFRAGRHWVYTKDMRFTDRLTPFLDDEEVF